MAITCKWDVKVGTVKLDRYGEEVTLTLYGGGNVYACFCYDYVDDDGDTCHTLHDFICDKDHLKNILKDEDNHYTKYSDFVLNGSIGETWQIAKLLVKAGHTVTIYNEKHTSKTED